VAHPPPQVAHGYAVIIHAAVARGWGALRFHLPELTLLVGVGCDSQRAGVKGFLTAFLAVNGFLTVVPGWYQ
jgi:hypothetical protein